jgi:hypothetical protein
VLLRTIGMGESASLLSAVVTGVVGVASTFASMLAVDRFGRRTLFLAGGAQMLASQVLIGAIMGAELRDSGGVGKGWAGVLILLIAVYVAGFGWSWGPLGWLVPSEIFPLEVRAAGQSVTVAVSFAFTVFVAQAFLSMLCHMKAGIFFFFAAWLVLVSLDRLPVDQSVVSLVFVINRVEYHIDPRDLDRDREDVNGNVEK